MYKHTVCQDVLYYQTVTQCHGIQVQIMLRLYEKYQTQMPTASCGDIVY